MKLQTQSPAWTFIPDRRSASPLTEQGLEWMPLNPLSPAASRAAPGRQRTCANGLVTTRSWFRSLETLFGTSDRPKAHC